MRRLVHCRTEPGAQSSQVDSGSPMASARTVSAQGTFQAANRTDIQVLFQSETLPKK